MNEIEQKEIEEMTRAICECYMQTLGICTVDKKPCDCGCADYDFAKKFYNAGCLYVKDKVVLSKEEYENFLKVNSELAVAQKSISFLTNELNDYKQRYESAEKRYEQLIQSSCEALEKGKEQVRKEMATEIYKLSEEWLGGIAFWNKVRKLCKECGAEVE